MKEIKIILYISSFLALCVLAFIFNQFNLILIPFIFLIFISCFLKKKSLSIFLLSVSISLIYFVAYALSSYYETNSLFLPGGDDEFFYIASKAVYENGFNLNTKVGSHYLFSINYKGYLLFNYLIIELLNLLPYYELDILSFRLIKYLVSSLIPVIVYNIFKESIFKLSNKGILLLALFPHLIFFNYSLLRESYISLLFGAFLYVIIYCKNYILKYLFALVLLIITFSFREISGLFLLIFILFFTFKIYYKNIFFSSIIVLSISLLSIWLLSQTTIGTKLVLVRDAYIELSTAQNSSSLGLSILLSDNPLMFPIKLVYMILSPIPPAFMYNFNITNFIKLIGNLSWYFVTFGCFVYYYKNNKIQEKISTPMILTLMFSLAIILTTSMDPRHIAFMYPFFFPIGIYGLKLLPQSKKTFMYFILLLISSTLYIFLKVV